LLLASDEARLPEVPIYASASEVVLYDETPASAPVQPILALKNLKP
jgi:hypothetical protein